MSDTEHTARRWPPDNPFTGHYIERVASVEQMPTHALVQSAVAGTAEDGGIPEHARELLKIMGERGREEWQDAGLLLAQYILSAGTFGYGFEAAGSYLDAVPEQVPPSLQVAHHAIAAWIHAGRDRAQAILMAVEPSRLHLAVTWLLCMVCCTGLTQQQRNTFLAAISPPPEEAPCE